MRRLIAMVSLAAVVGAAMASSQDQVAEGQAYLGFSFGGHARASARDFHYGLRLDYDNGFESTRPVAPLMQFDFTRAGLNAARVNGLNILKKSYVVKQNEEPAADEGAEAPSEAPAEDAAQAPAADAAAAPAEAAPAEEEGFFARSWKGIKNFFGGSDEPETQTAKAETPAESGPAENPADVAQGTFMGYNAIDWATLAVGAVGLGFIASEVANTDDSATPSSSGTTTGPDSTPVLSVGALSVLPTGLSGVISTGFAGSHNPDLSSELKERAEWLDGGTGHMGDLEPLKN